MFLIALFFLCINRVLAKDGIFLPSKCPKVEEVKNFDADAYGNGVWYVALRYPSELETSKKCIKLNYSLDGDTVNIKSIGIPKECSTYLKITSRVTDRAKDDNLTTTWTTGSPKKTTILPNRAILDTDYDNYAIVYDCVYNKKKNNHQVYVWIYTRKNMYQGKAKAGVNKYISSNDIINRDNFIKIDNSDEVCKAARKCCSSNN